MNRPTPPKQPRKQQSHERIVAAAARAIRRHGYAGVGVAEVMKEAGLTHGGFYAHFASRDALLAEAITQAGRENAAQFERRLAERAVASKTPLRALLEGYLSAEHLHAPEGGCVVAALCSEMPRQADPAVRVASAERVATLIERVRDVLPPGRDAAARAALVASAMVGALQLARGQVDEHEAKALLKSVRDALLAQHDAAADA